MTAKPKFAIPDEELDGLINRYTRDITAMDRAGKFDPITNREEELERMSLILMQRLRKNVMLLGEAGTGKTALFIGFAQMVNQKKVPKLIADARLIELEMSMIGAGSNSRAELEGRLIPIIKGVAERNASRTQPPIIFCIDEIHQLMIAFKASSYSGIADLMKPYLTAGDIYMIAATTREEYEDYVRNEPAIDRRFQKLMIRTPDLEMTKNILYDLIPNFEKHYEIKVSKEAVDKVVKLADRYIRTNRNPDKSILALDHACARAVKGGETESLKSAAIESAIAAEAGIDAAAVR